MAKPNKYRHVNTTHQFEKVPEPELDISSWIVAAVIILIFVGKCTG